MDSKRTAIPAATERALIVIFAPTDNPLDRLAWVAETLTSAVGGTAERDLVRHRRQLRGPR